MERFNNNNINHEIEMATRAVPDEWSDNPKGPWSDEYRSGWPDASGPQWGSQGGSDWGRAPGYGTPNMPGNQWGGGNRPELNSFEKSRLAHYGIDVDNFEGGMQKMFEARREEKFYQELMKQGRYADVDKCKHNKGYRQYLMQNFDENNDDPFGNSYEW